jgi:hypothetical protein
MKHLREYKIFESDSTTLTKEEIIECFQSAFDYCESHEIGTIYFNVADTEDCWHNDFSNDNVKCEPGFEITLEHSFWGQVIKSEILDNFISLLNEVKSSINFFKEKYDIRDIYFTEGSNNSITIIICP